MTRDPSIADTRRPKGPYGLTWLAAVVLLACALAASEFFWRTQGFLPSVTDDEELWALQRGRVNRAGPKTVLILGRSRIQQEFVPEVFREVCPEYGAIQLAVGGLHPVASLRDIAVNTAFSGVVLCSISDASLLPELWEQQRPYLDFYYKEWGPLKRTGRAAKAFLQERLALLAPELSFHNAALDWLRGKLEPQFLRITADRHHSVDYRKVDLGQFTEDQYKTIMKNIGEYTQFRGYAEWPAGLGRVEDLVALIQRRGGRVVFIRCPTSGPYREIEEQYFPRKRFWDVFARSTSAYTLHFEDVPGMRGFVCAEGSHLNLEDTKTFTRLLATELQRAGIIR